MVETEAVVVAVEDEFAVIETGPRASGCGRCHEPGGCGGSLLLDPNSLTAAKRQYRVSNGINASAGDRVLLCTQDGALLGAALLSYGVPLLLAIMGAAMGTWQFDSDVAAIAGTVLGLCAGFFFVRFVAKSREPVLSLQFKSHSSGAACFERKAEI